MTPNKPGGKNPMRAIAQTIGSAYSGAWGFIKGVANPAPVGDALGELQNPYNRSGGGTPPSPPFSPGQWMRIAANSVLRWGGQKTFNIDLVSAPYPTADSDFDDPRYERLSGKATKQEHEASHTTSVVSASRVIQYLLSRFDPIRGMTPARLQEYLEQWQLGFLRWLAITWSYVRERDDQLKSVEAKRIFAVSRLDWEIHLMEESPEAQAQKEALEAFYNNLQVTDVLDQNQVGNVHLMIRHQMRAIGYKYSVHEIVWKPFVDETGKDRLTARLRHVPLWFFENRTGVLRYLPYELALDGIPLDAGGWLVTVGDGLLIASSIAYLYKQLALKSWVNFADKFGIPMLMAFTKAAYNSTEWQQMLSMLQYWRSDGAALMNEGNKVEAFDVKGTTGECVQERLLDRMDRALARLWRGGDLSTMSRGGSGTGALPQMEQEDELAEADAILCSEACNWYIDRYVVQYLFGKQKPLAYFRIVPPLTTDTAKEIAVDQFLVAMGAKLALKDAMERYGRRQPDPSEELMTTPAPAAGADEQIGKGIGDGSPGGPLSLGNADMFRAAAMRELTRAQTQALVPLAERLRKASEIEDDGARRTACEEIKKDLPKIFKSVSARSGELVTALEQIVGTALISGATQAAAAQAHA